MPRVFVVDTNVVVAGLITARVDSPTVAVLDAMLDGRMLFLLSPDLLGEYRNVLLRPHLVRAHGLAETEVDNLLTEITANAIWREPAADAGESPPDPGDAHLWALLADEPGAILVTGDQLLYEQPRAGSVAMSPGDCAELLGE